MATAVSLTADRILELLSGLADLEGTQEQQSALLSQLKDEIAASMQVVSDFKGNVVPRVEAGLEESNARLSELNGTIIPSLQLELDNAKSTLDNVRSIDIPALREDLDAGLVNFNDLPQQFFQPEEPIDAVNRPLQPGDIWYDTDDDNKQYQWNGTEWSTFAVDIPELSLTARMFKTDTHMVDGAVLTNATPTPDAISWDAFFVQYKGVGYDIPAGSTSERWVWWRFNGGAWVIETGPAVPQNLTTDDLVLFRNVNGVGMRMQTNTIVDGELIVDGSIFGKALAANTITADVLDVDSVTAGILDAGILQSQLTITGIFQIADANMGWSAAEGLYLGSGTRFYGDSRTNQIEGNLVTSSVAIKTGLSIGGDADVHGVLTLSNGVPDPTARMAVSQTWPRVVAAIGDGIGDNAHIYLGLVDIDAQTWAVAVNFFDAAIRKLRKSDGAWLGDYDLGPWKDNFAIVGGITLHNGNFYVLGSDKDRNGDIYIYRLESTGTINKLGEYRIGNLNAFGGKRVRLFSNGVNVGLVYASSNGNIYLRYYKPDLSGVAAADAMILPDVGHVHIGGVHYGPGHSGGPTRLWIATQQSDNRMVRAFTTANTRVPSEDFPHAGSASIQGLAVDYNGGTNRFSSYDKSGVLWSYSQYATGGTVNAQYTYYDGDDSVYPAGTVIGGVDKSGVPSGPHETAPSPITSFNLSPRAWPVVTAPPAPDELVTDVTQVDKANRIGIYAAMNAPPRLQEYLSVGVRTLPQTDAFSTSGALAGYSGVPSFETASVPSPGRFRSGADVNGSPVIDLLGSGSGRTGPYRWGAGGVPLNHGQYYSTSSHAVESGAFTTRLGWVSLNNNQSHGISYSNGVFTISQSGLWFLSAGVSTGGSPTTARRITSIQVNGSEKFRAETMTTQSSMVATPVASGAIYLVAGDTIQIRGYQNSGSDLTFNPTAGGNFFTAFCLAAY